MKSFEQVQGLDVSLDVTITDVAEMLIQIPMEALIPLIVRVGIVMIDDDFLETLIMELQCANEVDD